MHRRSQRTMVIMVLAVALGAMLAPIPTHAAEVRASDAPLDRTGDDPRFARSTLQPPAAPRAAPWGQTTAASSNPHDPTFWGQVSAMGSKWIMDATVVMGASAALSVVSGIAGLVSISQPMLFRTPRELTVDLDGLPLGSPRGLAEVVRQFALAVIAVILAYRIAALTTAYQHADAVQLAMQVGVGIALSLGSWDLCSLMIDGFNRLADQVVGSAFGSSFPTFQTPPAPIGSGVSLVYSAAAFFHYAMVFLLLFQSFQRIIVVNLLLVASPLIGIAVVTDGGWNYARVWFFRMVESLVTPIIWAVALAVAQALIAAWLQAGPSDDLMRATSGMILAGFAYYLVSKAPRLVGIAAAESLVAMRAMVVTSILVQRMLRR